MPCPPEARRRTGADNRSSLHAATRPAARCVTRSLSHGADGGVDLWLHSNNQPDGARASIVQCQHGRDTKPISKYKTCGLRDMVAAQYAELG